MTKLPLLSAHEVIKALSKKDFVQVAQKGSHIKLKRKEIPRGTLRSIIRQSGLDQDEFLELF